MSRLLAAAEVSFAYERGHEVLRDVGAVIHRGRLTGIVGPNGSGKSTLLRLLGGLLQPRTGAVLIDGQPLARLGPRTRARTVAFLPQSVEPIFSLTAFEVVCLGRYPHAAGVRGLNRHDHEAVRRCLDATSCAEFAGRLFSSLSGGERQRVLLASILAQEPELLLLDEPTAALDIHHEAGVFALLARLAREGYGVGVVTHDLNLAGAFCDDMVLLGTGHNVAASGAPADVLQEAVLSQAYGAAIRVAANPLTGGPLVAAAMPEVTP
ncbi:MAG: ABC transporter ATP-binding protein [Candidatus Hydrogenedentota bacterium]